MIHVEGLEIRYFRSVWRAKIRDLRDITVFSGKNDVGKSNLLKALNLFFNNRTDWNAPFDFARDFSRVRLNEVRKIPFEENNTFKLQSIYGEENDTKKVCLQSFQLPERGRATQRFPKWESCGELWASSRWAASWRRALQLMPADSAWLG
jgi:predicted ATP-dependent endonuclease of OLD family